MKRPLARILCEKIISCNTVERGVSYPNQEWERSREVGQNIMLVQSYNRGLER